ncbi:MAG: hypothetical protein PWR03_2179 [Tenuifilum sp.]|jgi:hypothetical protein|uniref:RloB family protein n=1 Tax=Tenuifilum sp. TaxID=2760880 RepID=UPI0024ABA41A|nr:RloB family protein [Tenuifilum sp.]MDI3527995.1 hypothetical protein [Tenuifilum sp.]
MTRRKTKISKPRKDTYAIVVDGETEFWYFQMLKRNELKLQVNIEPKIPQKKKLNEQYKKVLELAEDFTKVFWIIDLDVVIKKSKEAKKGNKTQLQKLKQYINTIEKKYNNVITILNNPCLEFWFILHYVQTTKYYSKCQIVERELKKHLNDYEKTQKYFTEKNNDIYLKLKSKLKTAIANAQLTNRRNFNEIECGICEMNLFYETDRIKEIIYLKPTTKHR